MPVDEDQIELKIKQIEDFDKDLRSQQREIKEILNVLYEIKQVDIQVGVDPNGNPIFDKDTPIDRQTGSKFNPARRQEVYDLVIAKANSFLGL